jgi:ABC-type multidrug transport system ATPase subunit
VSALLTADSVGKAFGRRKVLQSAYLEAKEGEITLVLGRNGEGKSTLLKIAAGCLRPDHGLVRYAGRIHTQAKLHHLAREGLFFLPDQPFLSSTFTIRKHMEILAAHVGAAEVGSAAQSLNVDDLLDRVPGSLSGGERKRTDLAFALARQPRCLLVDEPFRGIDPLDAEVVTRALLELTRNGCAVVITGHEVPTLFSAASNVVWIVAGTSHLLGSPDVARRNEQFRREYLYGRWTAPEHAG